MGKAFLGSLFIFKSAAQSLKPHWQVSTWYALGCFGIAFPFVNGIWGFKTDLNMGVPRGWVCVCVCVCVAASSGKNHTLQHMI